MRRKNSSICNIYSHITFMTFPKKTIHIFPEKACTAAETLYFWYQNKDADKSIIFLLFPTPIPIKMVISSNLWCINNKIMALSPKGDFIITGLPFSILAAPARATNLVSASSWSLDFSVTTKATCWAIFIQWSKFENYITLSPTFFFPSFNLTSIRLNNVSLFAPFHIRTF